MYPFVAAFVALRSTSLMVSSAIFAEVIAPVPIVRTPAFVMVASPESETKVGTPVPFATRNCAEVPAAVAWRIPEPLP